MDPIEIRDSLSAAFDEAETAAPVEATSTPVVAATPAPEAKSDNSSPAPTLDASAKTAPTESITTDKPKEIAEVVAEGEKPAEKPAIESKIDRAPQSWKGEAKKLWSELPAGARQEVIRREREVTKVLQDSAQDRQRVASIQQVLAPHMERIQEVYQGNPLTAINNLLGIERVLMRGDTTSKAQTVANIIKQFNIDVVALDHLLAGSEVPPEAQQQTRIDQLVSQKLAPVMSFIERQQMTERQQQQQLIQQATDTMEQMATDPQFPYFDEVREDMADLIEMSAKKGLYLSLPEAYNKAVRMNDVASQASVARQSSQVAAQAALTAHQVAQRAKGAALSVSGNPSGVGPSAGNPADLRGTIASAMDSMGGRV